LGASCRGPVAAPSPTRAESTLSSDLRAPVASAARAAFLGVLVAPQTVDVAAQLDGRVRAVSVGAGDHVDVGATIANLDVQGAASEIEMAKAAVLSARGELDKARLELAQDGERARRRAAVVEVANGTVATVSGEELESARYAEKIARARVITAQAALKEKRAHVRELETLAIEHTVRAPFAGTVSLRYVDAGATVRKGQSIVRLIERAALRVRFAVPEPRAGELRIGARVRVLVGASALQATVEKLAPEVDAAARAVFAEARLDDESPSSLRSGQQVRVALAAPSG
jgi:RND family efflux transporter MFP subunit